MYVESQRRSRLGMNLMKKPLFLCGKWSLLRQFHFPPPSLVRHHWKTIRLLLTIALLIGGVWGAVIAYDQGFTNKWKNYIIKELEKQGIAAQIGRLTIDPVNGLTARDVSLFDLTNRNHHLADISHIGLDVDLAKIMDGEDFLRTVDLRNASLSMPVDPDMPDSPAVEIKDLNARLHFAGNRVDITTAEGTISGIRVRVRGSIELPSKPTGTKEEMERLKKERARQLAEIKQRRGVLRSLVQFLDRFTTTKGDKATLDIDLDGPLAEPGRLHASLRLQAANLQCGRFSLQSLRAEADLSGGLVSLRHLELQDKEGQLTGQAFWQLKDGKSIDFWVDSTVDLHALMKGLVDAQSLGEVVFYQPPHVRADGKILLPDELINPKAKPKSKPNSTEANAAWSLPLDVVARVDCRKFTSRGVIFDGLHGDFAVKETEFYARNLQLEHASGTATGQVMRTKEGGLKYHLKWNVSLLAALPFVDSEPVQQALTAFEFTKDSFVSIEALGAGADLTPATWTGSVVADLRNFNYREVPVKSVTGDITLADGKCIARNVVMHRPDGDVRATQVNLLPSEHMLELIGVTCTTQPLPLAKMFAPMIVKQVEPYVFATPPTLFVEGKIALLYSLGMHSDLRVKIQAPSNKIGVSVAGGKYQLTSANGVLHWVDDVIGLELTGKGAPGMSHSGVTCARESDVQFNGQFGVARKLGSVLNWDLVAHSADDVKIALGGKEIPAQSMVTTVQANQGKMQIDGTARVYGGGLVAAFNFPDATKDVPYTASVKIDKVSYAKLAKLFDPTKDTVGELSGFLNFTGSGSSTANIKGTGRIVINDGDVFAIPLLGPLSKLFATILPVGKLIYSVAREATADIKVENGTAMTEKFEAQTSTFKLLVSGLVDYTKDRVDLTARMNLRGAPGLLLFPVSKLFEYEAQGTMGEPAWRPKYLSLPFNNEKTEGR